MSKVWSWVFFKFPSGCGGMERWGWLEALTSSSWLPGLGLIGLPDLLCSYVWVAKPVFLSCNGREVCPPLAAQLEWFCYWMCYDPLPLHIHTRQHSPRRIRFSSGFCWPSVRAGRQQYIFVYFTHNQNVIAVQRLYKKIVNRSLLYFLAFIFLSFFYYCWFASPDSFSLHFFCTTLPRKIWRNRQTVIFSTGYPVCWGFFLFVFY